MWTVFRQIAAIQDVPEVLAAYEANKRFNADPVMREKIRASEQYDIDRRLDRAGALAEGKAKGRTEEKIENARNFKHLGVPIATIAEATGLSSPLTSLFFPSPPRGRGARKTRLALFA